MLVNTSMAVALSCPVLDGQPDSGRDASASSGDDTPAVQPVVAVELNRNELKWDSHTQTALTLLRESTNGITRYKRQNDSALLKSDG